MPLTLLLTRFLNLNLNSPFETPSDGATTGVVRFECLRTSTNSTVCSVVFESEFFESAGRRSVAMGEAGVSRSMRSTCRTKEADASASGPKGAAMLGSPFFAYFLWRSKESELPPGNPGPLRRARCLNHSTHISPSPPFDARSVPCPEDLEGSGRTVMVLKANRSNFHHCSRVNGNPVTLLSTLQLLLNLLLLLPLPLLLLLTRLLNSPFETPSDGSRCIGFRPEGGGDAGVAFLCLLSLAKQRK